MYSPYNIPTSTYECQPYRTDNSTNTGYNVPTHNANNTIG